MSGVAPGSLAHTYTMKDLVFHEFLIHAEESSPLRYIYMSLRSEAFSLVLRALHPL